MDIFFEIHQDLPREAPGDNESTRKVFALLTNLPAKPSILDIGCGPGMQTIEIAKLMDGTMTAVDIHQPFLEELKRRAVAEGVSEKVITANASMFSLEFTANSFDVIWSEGAIYIIGFKKGLQTWRPLLKSGGYLVVSELSWLKSNPPAEIKQYWEANYPEMKTIEANLSLIEDSRYRKIGHYVLPESGWWDSYYIPLEEKIAVLRKKYKDNVAVNQELDSSLLEIELYRKYSDWYGYVFYLMQVI